MFKMVRSDNFWPYFLGNEKLAEILLRNGANVNVEETAILWTPLFYVIPNGKTFILTCLGKISNNQHNSIFRPKKTQTT